MWVLFLLVCLWTKHPILFLYSCYVFYACQLIVSMFVCMFPLGDTQIPFSLHDFVKGKISARDITSEDFKLILMGDIISDRNG